MEDIKEQVTNALEHFKQQRDELQVQLHLAKADAKDEWVRLESSGKKQNLSWRRHGRKPGRRRNPLARHWAWRSTSEERL